MMKITQFKNRYRFLSNFYPCTVEYKNRIFPSSEHAYMSEKSSDIKWKDLCASKTHKPSEIKKLSRSVELIEDWDTIKFSIMYQILKIKFQNKILKKKLLETGDSILEEGNMWNDKIWGICLKTNTGENNLGKILMKIRSELIEEV